MRRQAAKSRAKISEAVEARLLLESRRRCCLCVFLNQDQREKQVQVAHISRDRSDSSYENLVILCLNHHDRYDSRPSQSKGFKPGEVRDYKERLTQLMRYWECGPSQFLPSALAAAVTGIEPKLPTLPSERLPLRGATDDDEEAIARLLFDIDQFQVSSSLSNEWGLRAERLGSRSLFIGLFSRAHGDWLAWVAPTGVGTQLKPEVTLDIRGQFHSHPAVGIIPRGDSYCLLINRLTFHGTGAERHSEIWYLKRGEELVEVLDYPTHAYVAGWCSFQREIRAIPLQKPEALVHGVSLEIKFRADYSTNEFMHENTPLFSEERLFHAIWDDEAELFVPTSNSQLSAADVDALFNEGDNEFFQRHRAVIEELLGSEVQAHRHWAEGIHAQFAIRTSEGSL
jgi:hypothetical protein